MDPATQSRRTGSHLDPQPQAQSGPQGPASTDASRLNRQVATTLNTHAPQQGPPATQQAATAPASTTANPDAVSKALDAFAHADEGMVEAAASAHITRNDKVEDKKLAGAQGSENGLYASGEHQSAAQASVYGRAEVQQLANAYAVLVDAGVIVGAALKLEGELKAKYGKLEAAISGKLGLFAGAKASASGSLEVGPQGLAAQGKASAFAGAEGKGSAAVAFDYGALGLEGEGEAEGKAGAWAEAEGEISLSTNAISLHGEAKAFAGVEGTASATGKAKLYGHDAFTAKVSATGELGVGGEVKGGFQIRGGKIQLNVGASGALGFGGGGDVDLTADLKPMAVWTWRQYDKVKWNFKKEEGAKRLDDPSSFTAPLRDKLSKYAQEKIDALHAGSAENFVKLEKIQQYVGEVLPRKEVKNLKDREKAADVDAAIKACIEDALNTATKRTDITAVVTDGKVEKIDNLPEPDDLKEQFKTKSKTGKALDQITAID